MHLTWTNASGERVTPDGWPGLSAALSRRGLELRAGDAARPDGIVLVGAPRARFGPDGVRGWRAAAARGTRILVLGHPDSLEAGDWGLALPGLEAQTVASERWQLEHAVAWEHEERTLELEPAQAFVAGRGSARIQPPVGSVPGSLHPRGRGWFRFARTWDVAEAWPLGDGWAYVQLRVGEGCVGLLPDASLLSDEALADVDHRRLLTRLLHAWLPSLHALHVDKDASAEEAWASPWLDQLDQGCAATSVLVPGAPAAALRALVEGGLIRAEGGRVGLTDEGRARRAQVARVLSLERAFAAEDGSMRGAP